jgi:hypothetical protein
MGHRYLSLFLLLLAACPMPEVTFQPTPTDGTPCHQACNRLRALGCVEGGPTLGGTPCERVCEDAQLPAACVAKVTSCAEVDKCQ